MCTCLRFIRRVECNVQARRASWLALPVRLQLQCSLTSVQVQYNNQAM